MTDAGITGEKLPAPWRRALIDVPMTASDALQGLLLELGSVGMQVEDDETRFIPDEPFEPTGMAHIKATFDAAPGLEARVAAALSAIAPHVKGAEALELSWDDLYPEDWMAKFKSAWKPQHIGDRLWIVPSWLLDTFEPPAGAIVLKLDPGMAFGTGTHETTRLCMRAVESAIGARLPTRMLDVGTGTGILSIAAAKLGVPSIWANDIDPLAVDATRENAADNGVADVIEVHDSTVTSPDAGFDFVVANILPHILIAIVDEVAPKVAPGGRLLLSGILEERVAEVRAVYEPYGLVFEKLEQEGPWTALLYTRPG